MRYLKTYESFEYHGQQYAERICDEWGMIDLEDLENLFLEFADEGQVLIHPMLVNKEIKVTIHKIWEDLNDSDWLYNPLWDTRFASIKKQLERLGLTLTVESKNLPQRFVSVRVSKIEKVKESFEMKLGTMDILNNYGLTKDDIEELFLEFSDMGYQIEMAPRSISIPTGAFRFRNEYNGLFVSVVGLGAKSHEPEISSLIKKVIKNSEKLGLNMVEPPKRVTQFMRPSNVKFTFDKR